MHRRAFVASALASVATASLAGCSGVLDGGDGGSSGPESAVEAYVEAIDDGDRQGLQALVHPDAAQIDSERLAGDLEGVSLRIDSMAVREQSDGQALVEAEIERTLRLEGETVSERLTAEFDVREHDGEWLLYRSRAVAGDDSEE